MLILFIDCVLWSIKGLSEVCYRGLQEDVKAEFKNTGLHVLANPDYMYKACRWAGVLPIDGNTSLPTSLVKLPDKIPRAIFMKN